MFGPFHCRLESSVPKLEHLDDVSGVSGRKFLSQSWSDRAATSASPRPRAQHRQVTVELLPFSSSGRSEGSQSLTSHLLPNSFGQKTHHKMTIDHPELAQPFCKMWVLYSFVSSMKIPYPTWLQNYGVQVLTVPPKQTPCAPHRTTKGATHHHLPDVDGRVVHLKKKRQAKEPVHSKALGPGPANILFLFRVTGTGVCTWKSNTNIFSCQQKLVGQPHLDSGGCFFLIIKSCRIHQQDSKRRFLE